MCGDAIGSRLAYVNKEEFTKEDIARAFQLQDHRTLRLIKGQVSDKTELTMVTLQALTN